ncbi:MAG: hypothetical protein ACI8RD_009151 [Bacillariaceae sp.]|jgi:hypothetical protein
MTDNTNTNTNTNNEIDPESKAEAEIARAIKFAASVSQDGKISGLGASDAVLHITFNPTPKTQYKTKYIDESSTGEKSLILTYFAIQGLGEVPRLILAESGMPYESIGAMGGEDQSVAMEWRTRSPNGLLPMLSGAGIPRSSPISQSGAVIRFLAKRLGMDGEDNILISSRADVLYETAKDLGGSDSKIAIASIDTEKDYSVSKGPFSTGKRIEKMLIDMADPKDESVVLNYGQIQLFHVLLSCEARRQGCVKDNLGDVLDDFRINMENRTGLKEYLNSTARFPFTKGELGEDGGYSYSTGPLTRGEIKSPA